VQLVPVATVLLCVYTWQQLNPIEAPGDCYGVVQTRHH
jgi:hypothetical protein